MVAFENRSVQPDGGVSPAAATEAAPLKGVSSDGAWRDDFLSRRPVSGPSGGAPDAPQRGADALGQQNSARGVGGGEAGFAVQALRQNNAAGNEGQRTIRLDAVNAALGTAGQMNGLTRQGREQQITADVGAVEKAGAAMQAEFNGNLSGAKSAFRGGQVARPGAAIPAGIVPAGGAADAAQHMADAGGQVAFAQMARDKGTFDLGAEQAKLHIGHAATEFVAQTEEARAVNNLGMSSARMNQVRLQSDASILQQSSAFAGAEGRWNPLNDLNTRLGGRLGVIGLNFSPFAPGVRSDDAKGAALSGRLDGGAVPGAGDRVSEQARFFQDGGELDRSVGSFRNVLQEMLKEALAQYHRVPTSYVEFKGLGIESFQHLREVMKNAQRRWMGE